MKLRKWFGLRIHRAHLLLAQTQIQPGDWIVYVDERQMRHEAEVVSAPNDSGDWIIVSDDRPVRWTHILEWIPSGHTAHCTPQNCTIGGTAHRNMVNFATDTVSPMLAKSEISPTATKKFLETITTARVLDLSTNETAADAFVRHVRTELARGETVILYEIPSGYSKAAFLDPMKIWPRMGDETFRRLVTHELVDGVFYPPDDLDDGWVFVHYPPASLGSSLSPKD